jgi:transposase
MHDAPLACFKLVSAMETSLARDLMTDEEWAFFEHFNFSNRALNGRKPTNHRLVTEGVFWITRTGLPWRDLPEEFGKWSSVYLQFRRWTLDGLWVNILDTLNQSGAVPDALQMALPSWEEISAGGFLDQWAMTLMLMNVATRTFGRAVRLPEAGVPAQPGGGLSKSAASRLTSNFPFSKKPSSTTAKG